MKVYWNSAPRFHERILDDLDAGECDRVERLRIVWIAELRRRERKIAVFKAIAASGLLFLICGSAALIAYALEW